MDDQLLAEIAKARYKPYSGGAGPNPVQVRQNDLTLFRVLLLGGIKPEQLQYAVSVRYMEYLNIPVGEFFPTVQVSSNSCVLHVSYDRYGYCAQFNAPTPAIEECDQWGLDDTVAYILQQMKE